MEDYERALCVRGFHVYYNVWEAVIGEVLDCEREPGNAKDRYAVAVKKDVTVIGHLPRKISHLCSRFLRRGGSVQWTSLADDSILLIYLKEASRFHV